MILYGNGWSPVTLMNSYYSKLKNPLLTLVSCAFDVIIRTNGPNLFATFSNVVPFMKFGTDFLKSKLLSSLMTFYFKLTNLLNEE